MGIDDSEVRGKAEWYADQFSRDNTAEEIETLTRWLAADLAGWDTNKPGEGISKDGWVFRGEGAASYGD